MSTFLESLTSQNSGYYCRKMSRSPIKRQTLGILRQRGVPVRSVLDVGVQYGTPDVAEAFPDVLHVLFEPVAEYLPHIERAYANTQHRIVPCAVSDRSGSTLLGTIALDGNISQSFMTDSDMGDLLCADGLP